MSIFLELWGMDILSLASTALLSVVSVATILFSVNVLRFEGNAGAIQPENRYKAIGLIVAGVLAGVLGALTTNLLIVWMSMTILAFVAPVALMLYERNNTKALLRRFAIRAAFGAIVSGVGVAILGIVAFQHGATITEAFSLPYLMSEPLGAAAWQGKAAFLLVVMGFGAMIGIAPMHAGLSELYSKVVSPIPALLIPALSVVGVLNIFRLRTVADLALADAGVWSGNVLVVFGGLTMLIFALTLLRQKNYKRFFAEVTFFHIGLALLMSGIGLAGMIPALAHIAGIAGLSCALFGIAGGLHATYKTTKSSGVRNLFIVLPVNATLLSILMLSAVALPTGSLFMSAYIGLGYGLQNMLVVSLLAGGLLGLVAVSVSRFILAFVHQHTNEETMLVPARWRTSLGTVVVLIFALMVFGWFIGTEQGIRWFIDFAQLIVEL